MGSYFVVKLKKSEDDSLGFSLLKAAGFSHVIYEINENIAYESPASESQVEAGDVIVKVNGTDVHRHSTKEVLKCLRLSAEPVTLELKRDPKIKDLVRKYLASSNHSPTHIPQQKPTSDLGSSPSHLPKSIENHNINNKVHRVSSSDASVIKKSRIPINSNRSSSWSAPQSPQSNNKARYQSNIPAANGTSNFQQQQQQPQQPNNRARFEAYMMTGDLILNLSRTPQVSGLHTKARKIDSLGDSIGTAPQAKYDSSPSSSSPNYSEDSSGESAKSPANNYKDINSKTHSNTNNNINNSRRNHNKNNKAINNNADDSNIEMNEEETAANDVNDERDNIKNTNAGCASQSSSDVEEQENCNEFKKLIDNNGENADMTDFTSVPGYKSQNEVYNMVRHNQIQNNYSLLTDKYTPYTNTPHVTPSASMSSTSTSSASTTINRSETLNTPTLDVSYSMPTSPTSLTTPLLENTAKKKELASSVPTSPESGQQEFIKRSQSNNHQQIGSMNVKKCDSAGFRTSRSEDHLQNSQREGLGAIVSIDIDEDVNSSLNTLLDTRQDSEDSQNSGRDRIVWTYNAPVPTTAGMSMGTNPVTSPISHSSSLSTSPQHTYSPASPTSVSSSVMSSSGSKGNGVSTSAASNNGFHNLIYQMNGDQSISEAISNISSPDYQDEHDLLSVRECATMAISDASDSDSTLLVSDTTHFIQDKDNNNKLVIQVKGSKNNPGTPTNVNGMYSNDSKDIEKEVAALTSDFEFDGKERVKDSSPPVSDDGSDVDSLHSFHYSPKAVDIPSAVRLAKRLYYLDGFKKSDVSRHLSKNNEFSRVVADEYLKFFMFNSLTLDESLRKFLKQFSLSGETQERERVLVHFSKRYLECNPGTFNSQDAVHTLTCAIMLLNTDLHGQNIGRKMNCAEFIENLSELNDGENFPKDTLKQLYQAIKAQPLEWALDDNSPDQPQNEGGALQGPAVGSNPFLEVPQNVAAIEYKKGYVMRKCCFDSNNKKTPFGKRSWKMFYCTLRDMVLYLHKDERGFHKNQLSDNVHNAIRIHHSLASKASDYTKKQHVFRLQTADQSEYLFQTSDSKEVISWIDVINFVAARYSAAPLEGGVGSQKRFQRPLLPCSQTKFSLRVQLASHEEQVNKLNAELSDHRSGTMPSKGLALQNYKEKEAYLQYELKRYKTYVYLLNSHMNSNNSNDVINIIIGATNSSGAAADNVENDDNDNNLKIKQQQIQHGFTPIPFNPGSASAGGVQSTTTTNRYSYRAAIYQSDAQTDD